MSSTKKVLSTHSSSQDNNINKKIQHKPINPIRNSLLSNKPLVNQPLKKNIKSDLKKNTSSQNELSNCIERNRSFDYLYSRNDPQHKLKKMSYGQKENILINEKEIVLKSNEYRKAIAKINSLEKTIKHLQMQHSETLSSLHSEIARLQRACSEKTLTEAFKGTGLLTSLSEGNINQHPENQEDLNKLDSSAKNLNDQDIVIEKINKLPQGMNLLPKISSIKKSLEENNNIEN